MSHPRVEEVSDSEDDVSDPSEGDIDDFDDAHIMQRIDTHQQQRVPAAPAPTKTPQQQQQRQQQTGMGTVTDQGQFAGFQCLYPVYFDATRTRAEGRRVPLADAVKNPLAREMAQACGNLGLQTLFEPTKTHPKDWANPGRVKVQVKGNAGAAVKNKHHLYKLVAKHLRANPAAEGCVALRAVAVPGLPVPDKDKPWPRPAAPRGWKMGDLLPHYSPALTGGGVSENFLQDMMKEMQGQAGGGGGGDMASMLAAAAQSAGATGGSGGGSGGGEEKKGRKKGKK